MKFIHSIINRIKSIFNNNPVKDKNQIKNMKPKAVKFNSQLRRRTIEDFLFTDVTLPLLTANEDGSEIDKFDYFELFFKELPKYVDSELLNLFLVPPFEDETSYLGFAYLKNKTIVPFRFSDEKNMEQWQSVFISRSKTDNKVVRTHKIVNSRGCSGHFIYQEPQNIGAYIFKYAPKEFKPENANHLIHKQKYIEKYVNTTGANVDVDVLKVQFLEYLKKDNHTVVSPKDNTVVYAEFEKLSNFPVPKELVALFEIHNGVENTGFISSEKLLEEWKIWKSIFDSPDWTLEQLMEFNFSDNNKTLGMYTTPYWIPFYANGAGDYYAIDFAPNSKGNSGQIIQFGRDRDTVEWVATDLLEFLQKIINK